MNKLKFFFEILVISIFIFFAFSCGNNKKNNSNNGDKSSSDNTTEITETTDAKTPVGETENTSDSGSSTKTKEDNESKRRKTIMTDLTLTEEGQKLLNKKEKEEPAEVSSSPGSDSPFLDSWTPQSTNPEDFNLGPLMSYHSNDSETQAIQKVLRQFLISLKNNKINSSTLNENTLNYLEKTLEYPLATDKAPDRWRLGKPVYDYTENRPSAGVNIRLYNTSLGHTEGEVYLEKTENGSWVITDFQIDLLGYTESDVEPDTFQPETYTWFIN